ncbi:hypothetical protein H6G17_19840 [Chroococcidiopsis sp. FACHB-1243]|uniref:general stress protein n=1 Tax=Chroococcidiopsis sp. [FACHB-1243] TaxID=2692781 RepID=UPI0017839D6A|nr:general stress protein [Chroococcidiopsis sp. [FACHB-1243]]MBD2307723.1 hypothetical protein [Chroococcidiopsis sp. [FACHB-1243]]
MVVGHLKHAVGIFPNRVQAEQALSQLRDSGFPMQQVSAIAKDAASRDRLDNTSQTGNQAGEGARAGAIAGGATGGLLGLIEGLAVLAIPGVGPAAAAGAVLANTLVTGGIGAAIGGLGGALIGWGIPEEQAKFYQNRVARGDYLIVVEGTPAEIHRAEAILNRWGIQAWGVYDTPNSHHAAKSNHHHSQMDIISRQPGID